VLLITKGLRFVLGKGSWDRGEMCGMVREAGKLGKGVSSPEFLLMQKACRNINKIKPMKFKAQR
nr:hypothetical protein [Tanacetum cinerariifolium]